MKFDIYMVGVGGQGILTIGEILTEAALSSGVPANFYPSKGMAQRGGFVRAQLRLGRKLVGPNIPERSADLVVAMEVSEALKAVRFIKPEGDFVLFGEVWDTVPVLIRRKGAHYPETEQVKEQILRNDAKLHYLGEESLPRYNELPVAANIFVLGVLMKHTQLADILTKENVLQIVEKRWKKAFESNRFAFQAGYELILPENSRSIA